MIDDATILQRAYDVGRWSYRANAENPYVTKAESGQAAAWKRGFMDVHTRTTGVSDGGISILVGL